MKPLICLFLFIFFIDIPFVSASPDLIQISGPSKVCAGTMADFNVSLNLPSSSGAGIADFNWQLPSGWQLISVLETDSTETIRVLTGDSSGTLKVSLAGSVNPLPIFAELYVKVEHPVEITPLAKQVCGAGLVLYEVLGPEDSSYSWYSAPEGRQFVNRGGLEQYNKNEYLMYIEEPTTIYVKHTTPSGCTKGLTAVAVDFVVSSLKAETLFVTSGFPSVLALSQSQIYKGSEFFWYTSKASNEEAFASGNELELNPVFNDTIFYVAVSVNGCLSERVPVYVSLEQQDFEILASASNANFGFASASPNPFSSFSTIFLPVTGEKYLIQVSDASGRVINEFFEDQSFSLGEGLNQGLYFVRITSGEKTDLIRIVKQ